MTMREYIRIRMKQEADLDQERKDYIRRRRKELARMHRMWIGGEFEIRHPKEEKAQCELQNPYKQEVEG